MGIRGQSFYGNLNHEWTRQDTTKEGENYPEVRTSVPVNLVTIGTDIVATMETRNIKLDKIKKSCCMDFTIETKSDATSQSKT